LCETFENIRKYSIFFSTFFFATKTPSHKEKLATDFTDCADFNHRFPAGRAVGCGWGSFFGLTGIEGLIIMKK